jgi:CelD/BcsL family acetyltransferase involved in cellulose biosynthesis
MKWSVRPLAEFPTLCQQWQEINAAAWDTPLLQPRFITPLIDEFATGEEVIAVLQNGGGPVAMGIFHRASRLGWQTFQPAVAPLGAWICGADLALDEALGDLTGALPGINLLVALSQQDPSLIARPEDRATVRSFDYIPTARIEVSGKFEDFWRQRGKNLRHTVKRQRNKLARAGVDVRFEILTEPAAMAGAVGDYGAMESAGWKGEGGTAVHGDNHLGRFYTRVLEDFAQHGGAEVWRYWYDDKLVATDLCIHHAGTLIILKTTYDESERATSPAHLMRHEALSDIFDNQRFHRIKFYGRVKDWHTKLTDDVRTMFHVNRYRWPILANLHDVKPEA